jgi:hypothetical protein
MEHGAHPLLFFIPGALGLIGIIVAIAVVAWRLERKRRDALAAIAARLGLDFAPDRDPGLARQYKMLQGLSEGDDRYAFNILRGHYLGRSVTVFDFHYETRSTDSRGNSQSDDHYRHAILLHLDRKFPSLLVSPEGLFSKIAQALGYDDIDFESHEFSRRFCVRSPDKRFAYDFCNSAMIELLLDNPDTRLEMKDRVLALIFEEHMNPAIIEFELGRACDIRERMPAYLFSA